jgi:hypothetical protein
VRKIPDIPFDYPHDYLHRDVVWAARVPVEGAAKRGKKEVTDEWQPKRLRPE